MAMLVYQRVSGKKNTHVSSSFFPTANFQLGPPFLGPGTPLSSLAASVVPQHFYTAQRSPNGRRGADSTESGHPMPAPESHWQILAAGSAAWWQENTGVLNVGFWGRQFNHKDHINVQLTWVFLCMFHYVPFIQLCEASKVYNCRKKMRDFHAAPRVSRRKMHWYDDGPRPFAVLFVKQSHKPRIDALYHIHLYTHGRSHSDRPIPQLNVVVFLPRILQESRRHWKIHENLIGKSSRNDT